MQTVTAINDGRITLLLTSCPFHWSYISRFVLHWLTWPFTRNGWRARYVSSWKQLTPRLFRYSVKCWDKCITRSSTRTRTQTFKRLPILSPVLTTVICRPCETRNVLSLLHSFSNNYLKNIVKDGTKCSANSSEHWACRAQIIPLVYHTSPHRTSSFFHLSHKIV